MKIKELLGMSLKMMHTMLKEDKSFDVMFDPTSYVGPFFANRVCVDREVAYIESDEDFEEKPLNIWQICYLLSTIDGGRSMPVRFRTVGKDGQVKYEFDFCYSYCIVEDTALTYMLEWEDEELDEYGDDVSSDGELDDDDWEDVSSDGEMDEYC